MATEILLTPWIESLRVSSVMNKNSKLYGKQFLIDGHEETCWASDQGSPQIIMIHFREAVQLTRLQLTFQGGFVGRSGCLYAASTTATPPGTASLDWQKVLDIETVDNNLAQSFQIANKDTVQAWNTFKLQFDSSTDFYGRVILYDLSMFGLCSLETLSNTPLCE